MTEKIKIICINLILTSVCMLAFYQVLENMSFIHMTHATFHAAYV